ncbi:MAG: carboxy-S-adenosyl-L-methionine synthase CmoA [Candidatus Bathyarchaeia archaeon]
MPKDKVFSNDKPRGSDFEFNDAVAKVFDDMLVRSVPFYLEQQSLVADVVRKFWVKGTNICDLGCSTGKTLINLSNVVPASARLVGFDNSKSMVQLAELNISRAGLKDRIEILCGDLNGDLNKLKIENSSVVTMLWTLQFIRPLFRDKLVQWIYEGLIENGVLIVTEKILTNNSNMNRFFIDFYYDFKRKNGYLEGEIQRKREALENVLIPYRLEENMELFKRNGFEIVETFFQWFNFVGLLCVKTKAEKP